MPHHDMMQSGDALRWFHMWDYDLPPYAQIYVCMYLILIPYIDDALILFYGNVWREDGRNVCALWERDSPC